MGYVPTDEPFKKLVNQGMIQGVSSFVYRLIPNNGKPIFISYDIVKKIALPPLGFGLLDSQAVIALLPMLQTELEQDAYLAFVGEIWIDKIHVDISFVKNDELDIERFKAWRTEYADAILIHEDGKVTCGSAVEKMSKSKYNVVNPDEVIEKYGADAFRMFEMFLGPLDQSKPWDQQGIDGVGKFIRRFWRLFYDEKGTWRLTADAPTPAEYKVLHKTIKKIAEDIERLQFNTCISQFMIAMNELNELKCTKRDILEPLLITLAPFAPFLTEELWQALGNSGSIHHATFPKFEEKYLVESAFTYPVSINGKVRAEIPLALDLDEAAVKAAVLGNETIQKWTNGAEPKKFIFVKGRIINVVV
jgi:leucyl-tRNA synthetase